MNATLAKKLRFSDAVYAINSTPKAVRLWLQRGLVTLHTPRPAHGWSEYSFHDIAILALVRTLTSYGLSVTDASKISNTVMTKVFPEVLHIKNPENMPADVISVMWVNQRLYLYQEGDTWQIQIATLYHSNLDGIRNEGFDPSLPSGLAALRRELEPAPVFLSIDVETVLRTAFERATESANEGADENAI